MARHLVLWPGARVLAPADCSSWLATLEVVHVSLDSSVRVPMFGLFVTYVKWVQDTERLRQLDQNELYLKHPGRGVIHIPTHVHETTTCISADVHDL